jgi:hypothetical protein
VQMGRAAATLEGGIIGLLAFAVFFACQGATWWLGGRAPGAEARMLAVVLDDPRLRRWQRKAI